MSTGIRNRDDVDTAYAIQSEAAIRGGLKGTAIGIGLALIAHATWPFFRRQTLAFKTFLVLGFTISSFTFSAEQALLAHEAERRREENIMRRQARYELARQGLVGTETEIAKWKAERAKSQNETGKDV